MSNIVVTCHHCEGTGVDPITQETCNTCGGDGEIEAHGFHATTRYGVVDLHNNIANLNTKLDALALPTNVFHSHKIWEATDTTEYQALSDALEASYNKIVHMGTVDLNTGSNSRIVLWSLFDSESTTRAALIALLE